MNPFHRYLLRCVFGALVAALLLPAARGGIVWEKTDLKLDGKSGTRRMVAHFPFQVQGDKPVRITSVTPSCGCLNTVLSRELWKPGERGELLVEFDATGMTGLHQKTIIVMTDDAPGKPRVLGLSVDLAESIVLRPRLLFWKKGEEVAGKAATIELLDPAIQVTEVRSLSSAFTARLAPTETEGRYRVEVRPLETSRPAQGSVEVAARIGAEAKTLLLHVAVK